SRAVDQLTPILGKGELSGGKPCLALPGQLNDQRNLGVSANHNGLDWAVALPIRDVARSNAKSQIICVRSARIRASSPLSNKAIRNGGHVATCDNRGRKQQCGYEKCSLHCSP